MIAWPVTAQELERVQDGLARAWTPLTRLAPDWSAGCVPCCAPGGPGGERGAAGGLEVEGEWVGSWLPIRAGVRPGGGHAAQQTSPALAVELALAAAGSARTPEPLRAARRLARSARNAALKTQR